MEVRSFVFVSARCSSEIQATKTRSLQNCVVERFCKYQSSPGERDLSFSATTAVGPIWSGSPSPHTPETQTTDLGKLRCIASHPSRQSLDLSVNVSRKEGSAPSVTRHWDISLPNILIYLTLDARSLDEEDILIGEGVRVCCVRKIASCVDSLCPGMLPSVTSRGGDLMLLFHVFSHVETCFIQYQENHVAGALKQTFETEVTASRAESCCERETRHTAISMRILDDTSALQV